MVLYVVEDDDNIRDLLSVILQGFGYTVRAFENAEDALKSIERDLPSLAVVDLMLPGMDGLTAIRKIRSMKAVANMPILILTAKDREIDKVMGLDEGADDYMTKPFGMLELAARVRTLLRRSSPAKAEDGILSFEEIQVDKNTHEVSENHRKVELTLKEFELLTYLMENQKRVVGRNEILNQVWGYEFDGGTRTLDMHIRTLRQKLGEKSGAYIKTIRGVGYRLEKPEETA
ncbi:MAG: response regulator transcription factor [bacterium]|nr:response regulator transcription factor [bacterium]